MPNAENLIPNNKRSPSEVRRNASKGGKKSGETRRKKRDLKSTMKLLLSLPVRDTDTWNALSAMGVDPDIIDNQTAIMCALLNKALTGDVPALKEIRNLLGEDHDAERLKIQKEELKLRKSKEDGSGSNGQLAELIRGLQDDLYE